MTKIESFNNSGMTNKRWVIDRLKILTVQYKIMTKSVKRNSLFLQSKTTMFTYDTQTGISNVIFSLGLLYGKIEFDII